MLNQVVLVGRLCEDPKVTISENNKKRIAINIAVARAYKNSEGLYETDFIRCILWNGIAENTSQYCHKGDVVGIKGRLQCTNYEDESGNKKYLTEVIAEKVTFLSSKKQDEAD